MSKLGSSMVYRTSLKINCIQSFMGEKTHLAFRDFINNFSSIHVKVSVTGQISKVMSVIVFTSLMILGCSISFHAYTKLFRKSSQEDSSFVDINQFHSKYSFILEFFQLQVCIMNIRKNSSNSYIKIRFLRKKALQEIFNFKSWTLLIFSQQIKLFSRREFNQYTIITI